MTFVAGALVGIVLGLGAGLALGRRTRSGTPADAGPMVGSKEWRGGVTAIAAIALVVAAVALVQSNRHNGNSVAAPPTTTTTSTAPQSAGSTTASSTPLGATVSVPNVVGSTRSVAIAALEKAGLKVSIDTLALANVPDGFVISQNPLPAAMLSPGSTVALVVSAST